jgi:hypothetical protein
MLLERAMRTGIAIGFALCAALVIGFVAGVSRERMSRSSNRVIVSSRQDRGNVWGLPDSVLRQRDTAKWTRDSISQARWRAYSHLPPREVARAQAFANCAVSFEIRDTLYRKYWLLSAEARSARSPGPVLSKGWAYTAQGFRKGDTVAIVLPNVFCGDIVVASFAGSLAPPRPPLALDVR